MLPVGTGLSPSCSPSRVQIGTKSEGFTYASYQASESARHLRRSSSFLNTRSGSSANEQLVLLGRELHGLTRELDDS
jgi:hypothetical protein